MIKMLVRRSLGDLLPKTRHFFSSSSDKGNLVPLAQGSEEIFYRNVYGVEVKKHILPFNTYNIPWRAK
jgi:hypothetical protein